MPNEAVWYWNGGVVRIMFFFVFYVQHWSPTSSLQLMDRRRDSIELPSVAVWYGIGMEPTDSFHWGFKFFFIFLF